MRRLPYCCGLAPQAQHPHGSAPRKDMDRVAEPCPGNGGGRPPFPFVLPLSPLRTASPTPVRSCPDNERSPPACVGRRSMDGDSSDKSRRTRSGSRPKIMVARFVTSGRDLPCQPFVGSEVRSVARDRRLEWPPVRRVLRDTNLTTRLASAEWAGGPVNGRSKVGGVRAPLAGPLYRVAIASQPGWLNRRPEWTGHPGSRSVTPDVQVRLTEDFGGP